MINLSLSQTIYLSLLGISLFLIGGYFRAVVAAVIRSRLSNVQSAEITYYPCDDNDVAPEVSRLVAALEGLGFAFRGRWLSAGGSRATGEITLLEHPRTLEVAKVLYVAGSMRHTVTLLFQTRFADGTEVATSNSLIAAGLPRLPETTGVCLPEVHDVRQRYRIHSALSDHSAKDNKRLAVGADIVSFLTEGQKRRLTYFVETGYYDLDMRRRVYRLTWKGAVLTTLRLAWPVRPLYRAWRRRHTINLLHDLGIGPASA